jgi:hypothetical protein
VYRVQLARELIREAQQPAGKQIPCVSVLKDKALAALMEAVYADAFFNSLHLL